MREKDRYYKIVVIVAITVLILGAVLVLWPKFIGDEIEFVIEDGQSLGATARLLAEQDLIYSRYIFVGYAIFTGNEKAFKAGKYILPPAVSTAELVKIFSNGDVKNEDTEVTIPEGTNVADIDKIFAEAGLIKAGDFFQPKAGPSSAENFPPAGRAVLENEGFFFPDTYRFKPVRLGEFLSADEIVKKMKDNFELKTRDLFTSRFTGEAGADRGFRTIIIASMLEKEVQTEEDMRLVAGIIEKRLGLNMPLELDATVAYGVCYPKFLSGKYCDVSLANIVDNIPVDSVYNTYKRRGLPIGPISNPGLSAIRAALNPQPSDYLFYLSAKDGTTIFSRTGVEHEMNRAKHLR